MSARGPGDATVREPARGRGVDAPRLYAIADGDALGLETRGEPAVVDAVAAMAGAGVRWLQLRLKRATDRQRFAIADASRRRLEGTGTTLWINDRADLVALVSAPAQTGPRVALHLGQDDLSPRSARRVVGEEAWIGLSCHDLEQVEAAESDPEVDVVAVGPVYPTRSKAHPDPVIGVEGVRAARRVTSKPLVAIGGLDEDNAAEVLAAGADTVVMLGAFCRGDVAAASRRLVAALETPAASRSHGAGQPAEHHREVAR